MTRDYLESLGSNDAELDRLYAEYFGGGPVLVGDDTPDLQRLRARRWREVGIYEMGGFKHVIGKQPLGAFAENEPSAHEGMRSK